jgi:hypothetical protein
LGEYQELLVSELMPRYYEQCYRGNVFTVQFAAAALAAASATAVGNFGIYNPAGSGRNLVLLDSTVVLVTFSAGTSGLQVALQSWNYLPTSQTTVAVNNGFFGGPLNATAKGIPLSAGTLVGQATTAVKLLGGFYLDLAAGDTVGSVTYNFDGKIMVAPGYGFSFISIATVPTQTVSIDLTWMEIPI